MTWGLRILVFLQRAQASFPAPTWWLETIWTSGFRAPDAFFWPPGAPSTHVVQRHVCRQTFIRIN